MFYKFTSLLTLSLANIRIHRSDPLNTTNLKDLKGPLERAVGISLTYIVMGFQDTFYRSMPVFPHPIRNLNLYINIFPNGNSLHTNCSFRRGLSETSDKSRSKGINCSQRIIFNRD